MRPATAAAVGRATVGALLAASPRRSDNRALDNESGVAMASRRDASNTGAATASGPTAAPAAVDRRPRCPWPVGDPASLRYHDEEWGVPLHDERRLFELLTLEGAQAGLSWAIILRKREGYARAFAGFDPAKVARFTPARIERLLADPGIVRNRLKIEATIGNARAFLAVQKAEGSFDRYLWAFVDGRPVINRWAAAERVPARTALSDALSKDLRQRGFRFVGSTIVYAFLQATGVVNDHLTSCFRHGELSAGR
jgi:DNA-3-methyladenine glycosylase I